MPKKGGHIRSGWQTPLGRRQNNGFRKGKQDVIAAKGLAAIRKSPNSRPFPHYSSPSSSSSSSSQVDNKDSEDEDGEGGGDGDGEGDGSECKEEMMENRWECKSPKSSPRSSPLSASAAGQEEHQQQQHQRGSSASTPCRSAAAAVICCPGHHEAVQQMFRLARLSSLLPHVQSGDLVALDIDDTLIKKKHSPCMLLSEHGLQRFHHFLMQHVKDYATKQEKTNALYQALKDFVPTEENTVQVIADLQMKGAKVFGLTARYSEMAQSTRMSLAKLGIDLTKTPPLSLPGKAIDIQTNAAVVDGIVYCNNVDKGVIVQRLMELNWLNWKHNDGVHNEAVNEFGQSVNVCPLRHLWFIDDSLPMINGMMHHWSRMNEVQAKFREHLKQWQKCSTNSMFSFGSSNSSGSSSSYSRNRGSSIAGTPFTDKDQGGASSVCQGTLQLTCCHYTPMPLLDLMGDDGDDEVEVSVSSFEPQAIMDLQIRTFTSSGTVLNDHAAARALRQDRLVAEKFAQQQQQGMMMRFQNNNRNQPNPLSDMTRTGGQLQC